MGLKLKSLASALAVGFALLAFGPAASTAKADQLVVTAGFAPAGYPAYAPAYRYARPYRHAFARPYRAYRVVRVFAPFPFPHWVYRRVYYRPYYPAYPPYAGAYSPY